MENQKYSVEGVKNTLESLIHNSKYIEWKTQEGASHKLREIPNEIEYINNAINSGDLSNGDLKIIKDVYLENQKAIDSAYLFYGSKPKLENLQRNITPLSAIIQNCSEITPDILETTKNYIERGITKEEIPEIQEAIQKNPKIAKEISYAFREEGFTPGYNALEALGAEKYIDKKLEIFDEYFKSKNLEPQRVPPNCIDVYMDNVNLMLRKKNDSFELEVFDKETKESMKTEITSIEDLDSKISPLIPQKEQETSLEEIKKFLEKNDFKINDLSDNNNLLFEKGKLLFAVENTKEGLVLTVEKLVPGNIEQLSETKITSLKDFVSEMSNHVDMTKDKSKETEMVKE